ncbi:hypothetical protein BGZ80_011367 [Entomortierella chlamydospora]|uniref:FAD-binding domain-containing protein n=1 Tax=Entomortierella chlamydospora TaxID=101097 RepID=A0A9P6MUS0_9FUNG|nr:hypothetical protein BGZ79_001422 [Entomortierella chlamydospora]KAG0012999.1 hypothetical protein BGZ80_011367 [Entomortierella chlamydospora]
MATHDSHHSSHRKPHVLIVGAGLGGLFLGHLLDRQGVSYEIFERSDSVKPRGSVTTLSPNILPALEQLDMYEEVKAASLPSKGMSIHKGHKGNLELVSTITDDDKELGYEHLHFSRPHLHEVFLNRIPTEKVYYNKKVTSVTQDDESATITCSDGTSYKGDIVVGADGTYSGVREAVYAELTKADLLPSTDAESLKKGYICLAGTTDPLDPEKYPVLKENHAMLHHVIGDVKNYVWSAVNIPGNRISWNSIHHLREHEEDTLQNAEWGPGASEEMIEDVRDFLVPYGCTLGDLIDATPKENISRVFLEDKVFKTWSYKRVVLIGDACHKLLPSAGQGAVNALQDSIVLANCIYDIESLSTEGISAALDEYYDQRYVHVVEQYNASNVTEKIVYGHKFYDRVVRHVVFHFLPKSAVDKKLAKNHAYRPQVTFLPQVPTRGTGPVLPQKPSKRYQREQKRASSQPA